MHIKPWVVTSTATLLAAGAVGVVVATNDPYTVAQGGLIVFWSALTLALWGLMATGLLLARVHAHQAVWLGGAFTAGAMVLLASLRLGWYSVQLLFTVLVATGFVVWYLWKHIHA